VSAGSCSALALAPETIQIPLTSRTAVAATAPPEGVAASGGVLGHFRVVEQAPGFRCDLTGGPQSGRTVLVERSEAAAGGRTPAGPGDFRAAQRALRAVKDAAAQVRGH
jgi:hypothetical protein